MTLQLIVFIVLALFIAVCSVLAVTTSRILRAATYLLFVLFGTAGIYFQLNYSFLGAVHPRNRIDDRIDFQQNNFRGRAEKRIQNFASIPPSS